MQEKHQLEEKLKEMERALKEKEEQQLALSKELARKEEEKALELVRHLLNVKLLLLFLTFDVHLGILTSTTRSRKSKDKRRNEK